MEIDIEKYLSEKEIRNIIESELRINVKQKLTQSIDFERIFNNAAYHIVFQLIDEAVDGKAKELIKQKTIEIIKDNKSSFGVFRRKDAWEKEESPAYAHMKKVVNENLNIIEDNVKAALKTIPKKELSESLKEAILAKLLK
jgi:hypothetical protein